MALIQKVQKVPLLMKEENKESNEDYEPKVVSFGPYHHGKEKLKFVEDFKPRAVEMFIRGGDVDEPVFIDEILRVIEDVRNFYLEESARMYTDEQLAQMMLRDGCVILNYIGPSETERSSKKALTINGYLGTAVYKSIRRDMYLLENQVPLGILEILVGLRYRTSKDEFTKDMENYSFNMFFNAKKGITEEARNKNIDDLGKNALHLLEIFRRVIVTGIDNNDSHCNVTKMLPCLEKGCTKDDEDENTMGRHCNATKMLPCLEKGCPKDDEDENIKGRHVFRSVTDLKSKGIHLRANKIKSLKGIRFSPTGLCRSAELNLPHLYVDMYTRVFFNNLIAYELTFQGKIVSTDVTDYVSFMKLLVVTTKDVKELREKKIIINDLGSDDDVVQLCKDLNTYEAEDPSSFYDVKHDLEKHYNSTIKMWMANLRTTYFSNPWTIIALVGSLFLLCLDIVQTYYSVNPKSGADANQSSSPGVL